MAQPSNTFATNDAGGNLQDIGSVVYDVSPTETPFLSAIPKTKAIAHLHQIPTIALAAASGTNFVIEGDDATTDASSATTLVNNYTAISDKVARVTGSQEAVANAGNAEKMAAEMLRKTKELKRDVETILLQNNAYVAGNDTLAAECAGAQTYIITNASKASDATYAAGSGADAHVDGTARSLQESFVEQVLASAWDNGGMPSLGILGSFQKRKFSGFSGNASRQSNATEKKITNTIDVYIDPLGSEIRLVPCRQCPTDVVYFFDTDYVAFATLRDFQQHDLAKTGDSMRKQLLCEYTLEMRNQKGHAAIYDLTTS